MRKRYELVDPSRNMSKFWEIEYPTAGDDKAFRTSWGRIGSSPTSKVKKWPTGAKAAIETKKIVAEKENEGYRLVEEDLEWPPAGDEAVHTKLPRATCHECGKDVAVRIGGLLREHTAAPGGRSKGSWCVASGTKATKKEKSVKKSKCAHCGRPSKSPTDCPEPWEHSYFKGGCSTAKKKGGDCAWCKAQLKPLSTDEINWLAKHGWSSAQIKAMRPFEGRRAIKSGKNKAPGTHTKAAMRGVGVGIEQYRAALLKVGVAFVIPRDLDTRAAAKMISHVYDGKKDITSVVRFALEHGAFTDGKRCLLIVPPEIADDVKRSLELVRISKR